MKLCRAIATRTEASAPGVWCLLALCAGALMAQAPAAKKSAATGPAQANSEVLVRAMKDELERSKKLSMANLDQPYFIEYTIDDVRTFSVTASLGGLLGVSENRFRLPRVQVRVGDYKFDNTNHIYSDYSPSARFDSEQLSLDDDYNVHRYNWWLATDRAFKTAVEAIARKRAALNNITQNENLPDFWKAEPVQKVVKPKFQPVDQSAWTKKIIDLSATFSAYPQVLTSLVDFTATESVHYAYNTEGAAIQIPDSLFSSQVRASGQAADGMPVRDAAMAPVLDSAGIPADATLRKAVTDVAENVKALAAAPLGENYAGPVLFEGQAGPQILAELLGTNLALPRKPLGEPGRPIPFVSSELEGRLGARILPEYLDVIDDPSETTWNGRPLAGHFLVDEEGVIPRPVTLVEKGKLKNFLLTRQPVKGFQESNGRARIPGNFGARTAAFSNLFVRSSESVKGPELKKKLIEMIQQRSKPYGIIVRKMDYPSSASLEEVRRIATSMSQSGGGSRPVSIPLMVYRIYPDGREELIRGLRFRGLSVRSLKDILAVSEESASIHFLQNLAPFALMGAGGYVAPVSVIAPSLLFEDLELERPQDDVPKLPLVPPPPLISLSR